MPNPTNHPARTAPSNHGAVPVPVGGDLIHTAVTMRNAVTVPVFGLRTVWRVTAP